MKVVYFSITGQTRKFVNKLDMDLLEVSPADPFIYLDEDFIIVTPTYDAQVTDFWYDFLETGDNQAHFKGVAGGGNRNFNDLFIFTAKDLARDYGVPLIHAFEFQGSDYDVETLKKEVEALDHVKDRWNNLLSAQ